MMIDRGWRMTLRMRISRVGLAGIVLALAVAAPAAAQPYYPRYYPGYGYPYPVYGFPFPAYLYPNYPTYRGPSPNYPWVPPPWANPYPFFAPYSSGVGPRPDGNTHY
jgi:hypothetical protein